MLGMLESKFLIAWETKATRTELLFLRRVSADYDTCQYHNQRLVHSHGHSWNMQENIVPLDAANADNATMLFVKISCIADCNNN